jgi:hypothetical protein
VKKLITMGFAFAALAACASAPTPAPQPMASGPGGAPAAPPAAAPTGAPGGADASSAVRGFMAAAKVQSIQSLSMWWGSASGPTRDAIPREELEKRELIMLKCLKHDRYDVVGEAPSESGSRDMVVSVVYQNSEKTTHLTVVPGPDHRWFVQTVDLQPLHSICVA